MYSCRSSSVSHFSSSDGQHACSFIRLSAALELTHSCAEFRYFLVLEGKSAVSRSCHLDNFIDPAELRPRYFLSSVILFHMKKDDTTLPSLSVFTPPPSCWTKWTYEAYASDSVSGGILMQDILSRNPDTDCFPSGWLNFGRVSATTSVYSPGACPIGFTPAAHSIIDAVTTAICCRTYVDSAPSWVD
jgi:hypothetical protein